MSFTLVSCSKFPPSLHAAALPSGLCEELKAAALVPMDALLLQLLPLRTFAEAVLQQDQRELKSGFLYPHQVCDCRGMPPIFCCWYPKTNIKRVQLDKQHPIKFENNVGVMLYLRTLIFCRVKYRAQASPMSSAGEYFGSAGLPTRGGATALVRRQPVSWRDTQVVKTLLQKCCRTSFFVFIFFYFVFNSDVLITDWLERWQLMKWACAIFHFKTSHCFSVSCPLCSVSRLPLYQALFASFRRCHTERRVPVLLPGVMMKGQAQVQITLHHHVCVHLCASVAALSSAYLSTLVGVHRSASIIWTLLHVSNPCGNSPAHETWTYVMQSVVLYDTACSTTGFYCSFSVICGHADLRPVCAPRVSISNL